MKIKSVLKLLVCLLISFSLTGCAVAAIGYVVHQNKKIQELEVMARNAQLAPQDRARIRFFGQAVIDLGYYPNQKCYGRSKDRVAVSNNGVSGVLGSKKNISLGMPITPNVTNLEQRDGILGAVSKAFYREYAVIGGQPLTVQASMYETTGPSPIPNYQFGAIHVNPPPNTFYCAPLNVSFVPEKGRDYEISLDQSKDFCKLNVSAITQTISGVEVTPVALEKAEKCD